MWFSITMIYGSKADQSSIVLNNVSFKMSRGEVCEHSLSEYDVRFLYEEIK